MLSSIFFFKKSFKCESFDLVMKDLSRLEAKERIGNYFSKESIDSKSTKKMMKLAMKYRIRLKDERKRFCKKCYSDIKKGKTNISKNYKKVICPSCNYVNRWNIEK